MYSHASILSSSTSLNLALARSNVDDSLEHRDRHHHNSKHHTCPCNTCLPAPSRQLDVAQGWENVCKCARARCTNQLEHGAKIACEDRQCHCADYERRGEDEVAVVVEGFVAEPVIEHDFTADKALER